MSGCGPKPTMKSLVDLKKDKSCSRERRDIFISGTPYGKNNVASRDLPTLPPRDFPRVII